MTERDGLAETRDAPLRCPACHSLARPFLVSPDRNRRVGAERFTYLRCESCGLVILKDVPSDLSSYYEGEYHVRPATLNDLRTLAGKERFKLDLIKAFVSTGRLLEVGPSFGAFAYLAQSSGFTVEVVEPDPECRAMMSKWLNIRAFATTDASELRAEDRFDAIVMWQAFEHLPDAWSFLEQSSRLLRPGGALVIATPNPESFQARILRDRWAHLDAPRHTFLAPWKVIANAGRRLGLSLELMTMNDAGSMSWNSFGWSHSLANLVPPGVRSRLLHTLGRAVAFALRPIERTGGRGAAYTIVLRKT